MATNPGDAQPSATEAQASDPPSPTTESHEKQTQKPEATQIAAKEIKSLGVVEQSLQQDAKLIEQDALASKDIEAFIKDYQAIEKQRAVQIVEKEIKPYEEFLLKWNNDWSLNLASALAYHLLIAMFPIAVALISILGWLNTGAQQFLLNHLQNILPQPLSSTDIIHTILHRLPTGTGILSIFVILLAILTGSRLFVLIDGCFNIIYQVHARSTIRQNLTAIGMLLLFIVLTPIMILASSASSAVLSIIDDKSLGSFPGDLIFSATAFLGSLVASIILFGAIYIIIPHQHISIRNSWRGTAVAAIALQLYLVVFPLYAERFLGGYIGQVGFAIILLAFFYYFATILLLGAQVNAFFAEGIHAAPIDLSAFVHIFATAKNKKREAETTLPDRHNLSDA